MTLAPLRAAARSHRQRPVGLAPTGALGRQRLPSSTHGVIRACPHNGNTALRDVDLVVPEGDFVFLVGPSGAGKSTLIKLIIRDEIATSGAVILDGQDLARLPRRGVPRIRRKIGIVFQDFKLLPNHDGREATLPSPRPRSDRRGHATTSGPDGRPASPALVGPT